MKKMNSMAILLSACLVFSGCGMTNTAKGGMIGAGSGAALGALIGGIATSPSTRTWYRSTLALHSRHQVSVWELRPLRPVAPKKT